MFGNACSSASPNYANVYFAQLVIVWSNARCMYGMGSAIVARRYSRTTAVMDYERSWVYSANALDMNGSVSHLAMSGIRPVFGPSVGMIIYGYSMAGIVFAISGMCYICIFMGISHFWLRKCCFRMQGFFLWIMEFFLIYLAFFSILYAFLEWNYHIKCMQNSW